MSTVDASPGSTHLLDRVLKRLADVGAPHRSQVLSKSTLTVVSHTLEDALVGRDLPGAVFTGFQESRYWLQARDRYRGLAQPDVRNVAVFAAGDLDASSADDAIVRVGLDRDDPLYEEWFLLILTPELSAVLFAEDLGTVAPTEGERSFRTILTLNPDVTRPVAEFLSEQVHRIDPAAAGLIDDAIERFPPGPAAPDLADEVNGQFMQALEARRAAAERGARAERLAAAELRRLHDAKTALLSAASHELRTPLTVAHGLAETLRHRGAALGEAQREHLSDAMLQHTQRLTDLVDDLFQIDRISRDATPVDLRRTDLGGALADALPQGADDRIRVEAEPDVVADVDPHQFHSIVSNLVQNGLKYGAGGPVVVHLSTADDVVRLVVDDDGPGIPAASRHVVFQPFVRLAHDHPTPGTGIGLALVAEFTRLHHGTCTIGDAPTGGARVTVELPVDQPPGPSGPPPAATGHGTGRHDA